MYMFNSLSWRQYFTVVLIVLCVYYVFVMVMYFRKELTRSFRFAFIKQKTGAVELAEPSASAVSQANRQLSSVHELMEELVRILLDAEQRQYPKEELMMALQLKLRNYPSVKGTQFQNSVSNYINSEGWSRFNIGLEDIEVDQLW